MQIDTRQLFLRTTWRKIHLYLGLSAGFLIVLLGLTGSLGVYHQELDVLLNPRLYIEQPQGKYQSLDKIMAAVQAAHPTRYGSWTLEMPDSAHGMVTVWYEKPQETYFEYYAPLMVSVNPYTAEVVASRFFGQTTMTWLLDMHTQLRLDRLGWHIVGILGLLLMVSVGTGLYLWWPSDGRFWQALMISRNAGMMRFVFDMHRCIGLFSVLALLVLAFTGVQLSYPGLMETVFGLSDMGHGNSAAPVFSTAVPNQRPVRLEAAEFIARGPFPRATLRRVTTPLGETGAYRINLRQSDEINRKHPYTTVWIDRWSGHIKAVRNPGNFSWAEKLSSWMWPLHTGEALGPLGRLLWFLAGFAPLCLYLSGLLSYLHRQGKVRDRPLDFTAISRRFCSVMGMARRILAGLLKRVSRLAQQIWRHAPTLRKRGARWLQWILRMLLLMVNPLKQKL